MDGGEGLGLAETGLQGRSEQVVDEVRSGDVEAGEPPGLAVQGVVPLALWSSCNCIQITGQREGDEAV